MSLHQVASGKLGNLDVPSLTGNLVAVQIVHGVASVRKHFQCWFMTGFLALKYPAWDSVAEGLS